MHPFQPVGKHHLVEEDKLQVPSFPDSSFLEKLWVFLEEFVRHPPTHSDNVVGAFGVVVEDVPRAIDLVEEVVVHCPTEGLPIEGHRNHIVAVAWGLPHQASLFRWVSWDVLLHAEVEVADPSQQQQLEAVVDEDFDNLPIVLLVRVSWEVLRVVDTWEVLDQEVGRPANRGVVARENRIVPASPYSREELRNLAVDNVACAVAFHRVAFRRLCAACCLVVEKRSPP